MEPRLAVSALRIYQLEQHIEKLKGRIEEARHVDPERFINDMDARLDHLEGNHCDKHEFQCGSDGQECISDLFICDGHKDCHNGHDEDKSVCTDAPVKPGNVFTGMIHWTGCLTRDDHPTTLTITGTKRFHYFSARIGVQGIATSSFTDGHGEKHEQRMEVHGGYNYANRRMVLFPAHYGPHAGHLGLACEFAHGDFERADCQLLYEATLHKCAEMHLVLEHNEHHHDDHDDHHDEHDDHH
jgi:hypothetical protein